MKRKSTGEATVSQEKHTKIKTARKRLICFQKRPTSCAPVSRATALVLCVQTLIKCRTRISLLKSAPTARNKIQACLRCWRKNAHLSIEEYKDSDLYVSIRTSSMVAQWFSPFFHENKVCQLSDLSYVAVEVLLHATGSSRDPASYHTNIDKKTVAQCPMSMSMSVSVSEPMSRSLSIYCTSKIEKFGKSACCWKLFLAGAN
jgi:hypothetical protein